MVEAVVKEVGAVEEVGVKVEVEAVVRDVVRV